MSTEEVPERVSSYFEDVVKWHRATACPVQGRPAERLERDDSLLMGMKLIREEYKEVEAAWEEGDLQELADGAGDLIWVLCGMMARVGVDLDAIWKEIRRSNFAKLPVTRREDGKILKPPGWTPPDIMGAIKRGRDLATL